MFDETKKYKNNGHFFFKKGDRLSEVSKKVPELPGVYYVIRLAKGRVELVYIGKSGTITQLGQFKDQLLKSRINNKQDGMKRQDFFDKKMIEENIDGLDIYWFVTMDKTNNDLPGYVEGLLIQRFFEVQGRLPLWNKDF
ncbi:MAG: hypothetical protein NT144_00155 [Bacteroidia bacterium]|nr:hypothetical protein [Bacteroidia bacterium]